MNQRPISPIEPGPAALLHKAAEEIPIRLVQACPICPSEHLSLHLFLAQRFLNLLQMAQLVCDMRRA